MTRDGESARWRVRVHFSRPKIVQNSPLTRKLSIIITIYYVIYGILFFSLTRLTLNPSAISLHLTQISIYFIQSSVGNSFTMNAVRGCMNGITYSPKSINRNSWMRCHVLPCFIVVGASYKRMI